MKGNVFLLSPIVRGTKRECPKKGESKGINPAEPAEKPCPDRLEAAAEQKIIEMLPIGSISPNPAQPRRDFSPEGLSALADSIRNYGIIQPLTVRRPETDGEGYELVAGERRLRAAKLAGLEFVPCVVCEIDRERSAVLAIIENLQRAELNMFEEAQSLRSLACEYRMTQEEIARRLSCSQSYVANKMRLLRLSAEEQKEILQNALTERHARAFLRLRDGEERAEAISLCIRGKLNVAATEELVDSLVREREGQLAVEALPEKPKRKRQFILKDIRLFYNSVDHAVELVRSAGIDVRSRKIETEDSTELRITIMKKA